MQSTTAQAEPSADRGAAGPPLAHRRRPANTLGAFLRARREQVTPRQAGLPDSGVRRVPGLRREEVAMLAGISADYYLRLERGRDRNPSPQVIAALARVLRLDDDHVAHLRTLVDDAPPPRRRPLAPEPPAGTLTLLRSLQHPAFVETRYFDVVAANDAARALSPRLDVGRNQLRDLFLDPETQALFPDWADYSECLVANLRLAAAGDLEDPPLVALVEDLTRSSALFRQLWARHEVRGQWGSPVRLAHPAVGELTVNRERLGVDGAHDLLLVVLHAEPGSPDAERLSRVTAPVGPPLSAG